MSNVTDSNTNIPDENESSDRVSIDQKVELDLDDAPFLEDEEQAEASEPAVQESRSETDSAAKAAAPAKSSGKKKKLILAGISALILAIAAIGINFFPGADEAPPAPPPEAALPAATLLPSGPPPLPEAETPAHTLDFEPFWVEQKDAEGNIRFLNLKFSVPTDNDLLMIEMQTQMLTLRDALFYYLSGRPLSFLSDAPAMESLKADLMTVINEHSSSGKINDIFIENYLIQ